MRFLHKIKESVGTYSRSKIIIIVILIILFMGLETIVSTLSDDGESFRNVHEIHVVIDCDSTSSATRKLNIITVPSTDGVMGGISHWYHFFQFLLPNLDGAHDHVWGPASSRLDKENIFILFETKAEVLKLPPFCRFVLASLLTAGQYRYVHIGHSSYRRGVDDLPQSMNIIFTMDTTNKLGLFVRNDISAGQHLKDLSGAACGNILFETSLYRNAEKLRWFPTTQSYTRFRRSYVDLCGIVDDEHIEFLGNETHPYVTHHHSLNSETTDVLEDDIHVMRTLLAYSMIDTPGTIYDANIEPTRPIPAKLTSQHPTVVVYQRDRSRMINDISNTVIKLESAIRAANQKYDWEVKVIHHNENTPPCDLISTIKDAQVLIAPHGFQTMLLMYQPIHSMVAEVHAAKFFLPHLFGELGFSYRQRFGFPRSMLFDESTEAGFYISVLSYFGVTRNMIIKSKTFRSWAKAQSITISDNFIDRISQFMSNNFL